MLGNDCPLVLFPLVRRRLPLVVAVVLDVRLHSFLLVHLLLPLLLDQIAARGRGVEVPVLRLLADNGVPILLAHGLDRLHRVLLVHPENLQRRQGGLK